jgi:histidyl-tRNA synthetase
MRGAPRLLDELRGEDAEHFAEVRALLERAGVAYELDATLVRGLDYYTRTVFEFTSDALGAQSGVGGGGRYDGLVELIKGPSTPGPPTPGIGWAAGVERIVLAGTPPATGPGAVDVYVAVEDGRRPPQGGPSGVAPAIRRAAFGLLHEARTAGVRTQMELAGRSLKKQLDQANRLGARFVAIVGAEQTELRDMQCGTQRTLVSDTVVHTILRALHDL